MNELTPSHREKAAPRLSSPKHAVKKKDTRLIDLGLTQYEASISGFSERYRRGETPHTVHVWWARRPHSAMRALIFASLCKGENPEHFTLMSRLGSSSLPHEKDLAEASALLREQYVDPPKVLDMFGGGGTIAFEASAIGAQTHAIDSNQLSVFIQQNLLTMVPALGIDAVQKQTEESGKRVLQNLKSKTDWLFPLRKQNSLKKKPIGYFWSYECRCSNCGSSYSILKRPWVSKKNGKNLAFVLDSKQRNVVAVKKIETIKNANSNWRERASAPACPKCAHSEEKLSIKKLKDVLIGACFQENPGKSFAVAEGKELPSAKAIATAEALALKEIKADLPSTLLPAWSGIVNPALYGVENHSDFLNPRQRLVLLTLIDCLCEEYRHLQQTSPGYAECVVGLLSSLIDQLVDWNCRLSMWISQNEQVGRAFCGPGVAMMWEYYEMDPLEKGPANLFAKLNRVLEGVSALRFIKTPPSIVRAAAQELPFSDAYFDAIVTDPPYYDNLYYTVLADFFYTWKKILFDRMRLKLFEAAQTDQRFELVASAQRSGSSSQAHADYIKNLSLALNEAARVLKTDGVFTFVYAHSSLNGWLALIESFRQSPLTISSVQPLSIERKARPRAMASEAVNTCIAFVARKKIKTQLNTKELLERFNAIVEGTFLKSLQDSGWDQADVGLAVYAQGVGLLATQQKSAAETPDHLLLNQFEERLRKKLPAFKVQKRNSI